ncbi:flp pilus-assembly TadE/G-like family protein [Streptomyces europaeiscabiei]|uniref:Flp pilus-assembly TadE/G-like family protein n=1 Tax=Streptomyces europaeiscabiei TaxID=146819 RepID=A0AAJ2PYL6_9ACTN|nr:Rv3654c family TadE-like protein [Streptomyces europaeiscabiei]MDX3135681.1 flp pilus-assembly TadE/G-like family protein [Streptomyces europaeiscabiei]
MSAFSWSGRRPGAARSVRSVRSDRGSATVWAVGSILALCAVFGAVLALGQAVVIRHQAAATADLAALAAADHWMKGGEGACVTAERVARAQGGRLVHCEVEGEISDITAASDMGPLTAEARARAGPPGLPGPPQRAGGNAGVTVGAPHRSSGQGARGTARSATHD